MSPQVYPTNLSNATDSPSSPDGYTIGQAGYPLGFFGTTPALQPFGNAQAALTRGLACGIVATYGSTQSPSAVSQGTTAEQTLTVVSGTGAQMQLASGDMVYVNKPTSQAGLGYGNCRVSSGNTLGLTFINVPAAGGSITPTASENYSVTAIRGMPKLTPVLTPSAVAANSTAEQQFTVTGLPAGFLVQVNKPTSQAGLDIVGCRVVSNNVLGITFANVTSSPITPTAAETYNVFALAGLDAVDNEICYGFNVGTVGAIGAGLVVSGGNSTLTGLLTTDMVAGMYKPTAQANATNAHILSYGLASAANTLSLYFTGVGTGGTPTASEVYGIHTFRMNPAAPLVNYAQTLTPSAVAAATTAEQTFTVTGLVAGSPVWVNKPSLTAGIGIAGVRVSAANTLAITFINTTSGALTPPAELYTIGNFQLPNPSAGNCVYQTASAVVNALGNLGNAQRAALVSLGLLAGA